MRITGQALLTVNPKRNIRKNYGSRMIFGDEKLTPLRFVPRCTLLLSVVGAYNSGYEV